MIADHTDASSRVAGQPNAFIVATKLFTDDFGFSELHDKLFRVGDANDAGQETVVTTFTAQNASVAGSFLVDAPTSGGNWRWMAITDVFGRNLS